MRRRDYVVPILSFLATLALTLIGSEVLALSNAQAYVVFSVGTSISFALALIEQKLSSSFDELRKELREGLSDKLELYRLLEEIDDRELSSEVISTTRQLASGELPRHLSSIRIPALYKTSRNRIYASNVSTTVESLRRWTDVSRFRSIVETSSKRVAEGISVERTFILSREAIFENGMLRQDCHDVLKDHIDAGIIVRVIWLEDIQNDVVTPSRRLDRDFTVFDDAEVVDRGDVQVIYRLPSKKVQEFIDLRNEQLRYAEQLTLPLQQKLLTTES